MKVAELLLRRQPRYHRDPAAPIGVTAPTPSDDGPLRSVARLLDARNGPHRRVSWPADAKGRTGCDRRDAANSCHPV